MKIIVTKDDISKGTKFDPEKCMLALAIRRTMKSAHDVYVWIDNVFNITIGEKLYRVAPKDIVKVAARIGGFDDGAEDKDGAFQFEMTECA